VGTKSRFQELWLEVRLFAASLLQRGRGFEIFTPPPLASWVIDFFKATVQANLVFNQVSSSGRFNKFKALFTDFLYPGPANNSTELLSFDYEGT
jgi:hypothetical protein